jgi:hypothetical protein
MKTGMKTALYIAFCLLVILAAMTSPRPSSGQGFSGPCWNWGCTGTFSYGTYDSVGCANGNVTCGLSQGAVPACQNLNLLFCDPHFWSCYTCTGRDVFGTTCYIKYDGCK